VKTIICLSLIAVWGLQATPANNWELADNSVLTDNAEQTKVATS
jgi:hypothetical protein